MRQRANGVRERRNLRGKLRLRTLDDLDHRTHAARRARDLVGSLVSDLGGPTAVTAAMMQLTQRAALLGAYLEDIETRWVKSEQIPIQDYLAGANTQRRLLMTLGLER